MLLDHRINNINKKL